VIKEAFAVERNTVNALKFEVIKLSQQDREII
jgi:hypothetical protein